MVEARAPGTEQISQLVTFLTRTKRRKMSFFEMGGPPRSGMVVCRPLRSSLPETPGTPQCRPRHSRFMQTKQRLHFPDSGMGRYSRVWNGFQAFAARPAGTPWPPNADAATCALCRRHPTPRQTIILFTYHPHFLASETPPRSGMVVCRPLRSSLPETLAPPNADLADKTPQLFSSHISMGRHSKVWNGVFQAFTARPAGNP